MEKNLSKNGRILIGALALSLALGLCPGSGAQKIIHKKKKPTNTEEQKPSAEPDKELYSRAMEDLKRNKYTEGRLALQTLINTYPDSEYLAKAKLAVADSFYKEGGTSNLTQSVQEYKDFITFFPFLDEAAYAQMQVGMAHYKMMEKADRDSVQAQEAEDEFQTMLLKYPQSTYAPEAEQRLREVQEVLADGDYRVAHFYYTKQDFRASAARLIEIADRYPLYSQSDEVLWMLGDVYSRMKAAVKNEDQKNHWADLAGSCYVRIVKGYPQSKHVRDAKARLTDLGMPIPAADPEAIAQMQKEQAYQRQHHGNNVVQVPMNMLKSNPDVSHAAHAGAPNLNPPTDTIAASLVLMPNAPGPTFNMNAGAAAGNAEGEPTTQVDALTGGGASSLSGATPIGTTAAAQIIEAPTSSPAPAANATSSRNANAPAANAAPSTAPPTTPSSSTPPPSAAPTPTGAADSAAAPPPPESSTAQGVTPPAPLTSTSGQSTSTDPSSANNQSGTSSSSSSNDPKQESTNKKKKGIKKVIPF